MVPLQILLLWFKSWSPCILQTFQTNGRTLSVHGPFNKCTWIGQAFAIMRFNMSTIVDKPTFRNWSLHMQDHIQAWLEFLLIKLAWRPKTYSLKSLSILYPTKSIAQTIVFSLFWKWRLGLFMTVCTTWQRSSHRSNMGTTWNWSYIGRSIVMLTARGWSLSKGLMSAYMNGGTFWMSQCQPSIIFKIFLLC